MEKDIKSAIDDLKELEGTMKVFFIDQNSDSIRHIHLAIQALEEKQERENPKPLSVEDLVKFIGKPIWNEVFSFRKKTYNCYKIVEAVSDEWIDFEGGINWDLTVYGKDWIAYAHRPKAESEDK